MKNRIPLNLGMHLTQSVAYEGTLSEQQLYGTSYKGEKYQTIERVHLNDYQNLLYYRAVHGLSVYKQEEIKKMCRTKYNRILKVHRRTQKILQMLKQKKLIAISNQLFANIFPNMAITKELLGPMSELDEGAKINLSFDILHITKMDIVNVLLREGILPHNFYNLKPQCK
jgi:hypothetical protein